jgi:FkbM family methyltransferase
MTARISVVLSVYNDAAHLVETLDSILAQTEEDFELIAVDDGSTDESGAILRSYAERDVRVRVLRQENQGLTRALTAGCAAAGGTYIARHDSGDTSHPKRLAVQSRMLDAEPDVVFVSCATQYVGPDREPLWITRPRIRQPASLLSPEGLLDGPTHHGSVMFRRESYERAGQDYDLWYRLAEIGGYSAVDEVLYTARITPTSISSRARAPQQRLARLSEAARNSRRRGESEERILSEAGRIGPVRRGFSRRALAAGLYFIGEALRRNGDPRAMSYLGSALRTWPLSPRSWLRMAQAVLTRTGLRAILPSVLSRLPAIRGRGRATLLLDRVVTDSGDPRSYETIGTLNDGVRFQFDLRPWGQKFAYYYRTWEEDEIRTLRSLYRGGWFVDVGSSLGLYVVCMADRVRAAGGQIGSIEPVPFNVERQRRNIALNGIDDLVEIAPLAVGAQEGRVFLALDPLHADNNAFVAEAGEIEVPLVTLDALVTHRQWSPIGALKMDVEGYEAAVIAGARQTIAREMPIILAEFNRERMAINGFTMDESWTFLAGLGYEAFVLDGGQLVLLQKPGVHENLFFIPSSRARSFRTRG